MSNLQTKLLGFTLVSLLALMGGCTKDEPEMNEPVTNSEIPASPTSEEDLNQQTFQPSTIHFDFDRSTINEEFQPNMQEIADFLKSNTGTRLIVEGHCDQRGTTEYNLALGERRASSARTYLENLGVNPGQISTVSYGEERPLEGELSNWAYKRNRRAEFKIIR